MTAYTWNLQNFTCVFTIIISIAHEKCKKECDIVILSFYKVFVHRKIDLTQFPDGFRLNVLSPDHKCYTISFFIEG